MNKQSNTVSIGQASDILGVSIDTLRRWDKQGLLVAIRTPSGQRRYYRSQLNTQDCPSRITVAYARVSSRDQLDDLNTQKQALATFCTQRGWEFELVSDLGSGLNYKKKGLNSLLDRILNDEIERLVITHKDLLLRYGAELVFKLCEAKGVEVVIINHTDELSFEQALAHDVLSLVIVFSAKLYGSRSHKNKQFVDAVKTHLPL